MFLISPENSEQVGSSSKPNSCGLYLGGAWIQISAGAPIILIEVYCGFSQSLQTNVM
jgi:hypothetical protein